MTYKELTQRAKYAQGSKNAGVVQAGEDVLAMVKRRAPISSIIRTGSYSVVLRYWSR